VAIVVADAAPAVVPVIELRPVPMSIASLAVSAERVATNIDVTAGIDIGATRNLASTTARTLQLAVIVHNFPGAVVKMVKRTAAPIAVARVAFSLQPVALNTDVAAGLLIRTSRATVPVTVTIAVSISAPIAPELSVDIADAVSASVVRIKIGIDPIAVAGLAASAQRIAAYTDVAAGLRVVAGRN